MWIELMIGVGDGCEEGGVFDRARSMGMNVELWVTVER